VDEHYIALQARADQLAAAARDAEDRLIEARIQVALLELKVAALRAVADG
jgi:hypothetical protein